MTILSHSEDTTSSGKAYLDYAVEYVKRGIFVLPLVPGEKCPYVEWKHRRDQKPTEQEVRRWWKQFPDADIGMACGKYSGVDVLDFDSEDAKPHFKYTVHELPEGGFTVETGRKGKGQHVWLRYSPGLKNISKPKDPNGNTINLDVRTTGGIVVLPPCKHKSGKEYKFTSLNPLDMDSEDWCEELPELPQQAAEFLKGGKNGSENADTQATLDINKLLDGLPEGERDTVLFKEACRLRGKNINYGEAKVIILHVAAKCEPVFPEEEAIKCLDSAFKYEPGNDSKEQAIEIVSIAEIMDLDPQIEHIAEEFLNRDEPMILHSPGGVGKSTLAQQIAYELAKPADMMDSMLLETFPIRQPECQSLFVQSENTMAAVNTKSAGFDRDVAKRIFFPKLFNDVLTTGETFEDPLFIQRVIDTIRLVEDKTGNRLDVLFVDPLISFHRAEENGAGDMRAALDGVTRVSQETKVTPVVLHHDNRSDDYRGSSAINDWCRTRVHMVRSWIGQDRITGFSADDQPIMRTAKIPAVEIHHAKANNMSEFEPFTMVLSRQMRFVKVDDPMDPEAQERCLEAQQALKDLGGFAQSNMVLAKAISELTGRGVTTCKKDIAEAVKHGSILAEKTKAVNGKGNAYSYTIKE